MVTLWGGLLWGVTLWGVILWGVILWGGLLWGVILWGGLLWGGLLWGVVSPRARSAPLRSAGSGSDARMRERVRSACGITLAP